jgi:hypothetical protein
LLALAVFREEVSYASECDIEAPCQGGPESGDSQKT